MRVWSFSLLALHLFFYHLSYLYLSSICHLIRDNCSNETAGNSLFPNENDAYFIVCFVTLIIHIESYPVDVSVFLVLRCYKGGEN